MSFVQLSLEYFPDPTRGVPVYNGYIYVGEPDTDPEIVGNQKTVVLRLSDGSEVATAQPIRTGAGGVVLYDGSPTQLVVEGNYSIKVLDKRGTEVYYIQNAFGSSAPIDGLTGQGVLLADLKGLEGFADGVTIVTSGRTSFGDNGGGTWVFDSGDLSAKVTADPLSGVYAPPDLSPTGVDGAWVRRLSDGFVTPQMFGAITNVDKTIMANDVQVAFQAAMDAEWPVHIPAGFYYLASTVTISRHKIVKCEGLLDQYGTSEGNDFAPGDSHTRIYSDQNIHFFKLINPGIYITGGTYDASAIPAHTKAIFWYDFFNQKVPCWRGELLDVYILGNRDTIGNLGIGTIGVFIDFYGDGGAGVINGSYITHCKFRIHGNILYAGFLSTELHPSVSQFANSCDIDLAMVGVKHSIKLLTLNDCNIKVKHQDGFVLNDAERELAPVHIETPNNIVDFTVYDSSDSQDPATGWWKHKYTIYNNQNSTQFYPYRSNMFLSAPGSVNTEHYPSPINGHHGVLTEFHSKTLAPTGVTIPQIHGLLCGLQTKSDTFSITAYKGTGVDVETLLTDSASAGIPVSTDITTAYTDQLFEDNSVILSPSVTWNAQAVTDGDYIEIHATGLLIRTSYWWFLLNNYNVQVKGQILEINLGSVVTNELFDCLAVRHANTPLSTFRVSTNAVNCREIVVRFYAATKADKLYIEDIGASGRRTYDDGFFMRRYQPVVKYDSILMKTDPLIHFNATSTQLNDITATVNTNTSKQKGAEVFNSTLNKPVYATGTTDGSTWVDAIGTVVHTPV